MSRLCPTPSAACIAAAAILFSAACTGVSFEAPPGPGSGEGAIKLEPDRVEASQEMRLRLIWTAGASGALAGGGFSVRFPLEPLRPLTGFTPPHHRDRTVPGFVQCWALRGQLPTGEADTLVESSDTAAEAICTLRSGSLRPGDGLAMDYWGLAPRVAGRYSLRGTSRMWGARGAARIQSPADLEVVARPARVLTLVLPSTSEPGAPIATSLLALDEFGNRAEDYDAEIQLTLGAARATHHFVPQERGVARVDLPAPAGGGVVRAEARELGEVAESYRLRAISNPMRVAAGTARVQWGDLCFGVGPIDAEDVMPLDFAFLPDPWPFDFHRVFSSREVAPPWDRNPLRLEPGAAWLRATMNPAAFVACSDNTWGRPGTVSATGLEAGAGGLTAVLEESSLPDRITAAIAQGRAWATTGARMILLVTHDDTGIGLIAAGQKPLRRVALVVRDAGGLREIPVAGTPALELEARIEEPAGEGRSIRWIRAEQEDGQMAWSAPWERTH